MKKTMNEEIREGINQILDSAQPPKLALASVTRPAMTILNENNYVARLPRSKWLKRVISKENSIE